MYIRPKKIFWTLVLLVVALYAAAHVLVRTSWLRSLVLRGLSVRTGYAASASEVRFTPGLALSFRDFRLERPAADPDGAPRLVAEAPWLRLGRRCGGWFVRAPRARLEAFRENGVWTPSQATGAEACPGACVFSRVSPAFGTLYFDLSDAQVTFADGGEATAFVGVTWSRAPVRLPGRPGTVQNRLSYLKGPIRGEVSEDLAVPGRDEWYELPGGIARLSTQGGAEKGSERPEAGEIGGTDGPAAVFVAPDAPAARGDMEAAVREFFASDPEAAKAFLAVLAEEGESHAESAEEKTHAEPVETAEEKTHAEAAEIAEEKTHAEVAETAEEKTHAEVAETAEEKPHAEPAEAAEEKTHSEAAEAAEEKTHSEAAEPAEEKTHAEPAEAAE